MIIKKTDGYKDGGTIRIETDIGKYYVDRRIGTKTRDKIYNGYPKEDNSNIIENQDEIKNQIMEAWKEQTCSGLIKSIPRTSHFGLMTSKCPL